MVFVQFKDGTNLGEQDQAGPQVSAMSMAHTNALSWLNNNTDVQAPEYAEYTRRLNQIRERAGDNVQLFNELFDVLMLHIRMRNEVLETFPEGSLERNQLLGALDSAWNTWGEDLNQGRISYINVTHQFVGAMHEHYEAEGAAGTAGGAASGATTATGGDTAPAPAAETAAGEGGAGVVPEAVQPAPGAEGVAPQPVTATMPGLSVIAYKKEDYLAATLEIRQTTPDQSFIVLGTVNLTNSELRALSDISALDPAASLTITHNTEFSIHRYEIAYDGNNMLFSDYRMRAILAAAGYTVEQFDQITDPAERARIMRQAATAITELVKNMPPEE
ncbi:Uncharacterised protein [Candidatus Burarchaeum australiense]|nr:Uncharacterised protein [Candidatus Burarchaeum australiense]